MEWWQLIDFENPDNKVRVVRNLYIVGPLGDTDSTSLLSYSQRHYDI